MRNMLHMTIEIATAFFFSASIGIGAGVAAVSFTHRLSDGLVFSLLAFLLSAATYGYVIWRHYRPAPKLVVEHPPTIEVASSS
jgi:hypothetical protein